MLNFSSPSRILIYFTESLVLTKFTLVNHFLSTLCNLKHSIIFVFNETIQGCIDNIFTINTS